MLAEFLDFGTRSDAYRSTGPSCSFLPKELNFRNGVEQIFLQGDGVGTTNGLGLGLQEASCLGK